MEFFKEELKLIDKHLASKMKSSKKADIEMLEFGRENLKKASEMLSELSASNSNKDATIQLGKYKQFESKTESIIILDKSVNKAKEDASSPLNNESEKESLSPLTNKTEDTSSSINNEGNQVSFSPLTNKTKDELSKEEISEGKIKNGNPQKKKRRDYEELLKEAERKKIPIEYIKEEFPEGISDGEKEFPSIRVIKFKVVKTSSISIVVTDISRKVILDSNNSTKIVSAIPKQFDNFSGCLLDSRLVARIANQKIIMGTPVNRQIDNIYQILKRQTVQNALMKGASVLEKIYRRILFHIIHCKLKIIMADETRMRVINSEHKMGYYWGLMTSVNDLVQAIFYIFGTREYSNFEKIIEGFEGKIISDAYGAYKDTDKYVIIPCTAHVKRKCSDTFIACPKTSFQSQPFYGVTKKLGKAIRLNSLIVKGNESESEKKKMTEEFISLMTGILSELEELSKKYPDTHTLEGKAIIYALNLKDKLLRCAEDYNIECTNNRMEAQNKLLARTRDAFYFCTSESGAQMLAVYYTIGFSAKMNKLNNEDYLAHLLSIDYDKISEEELDKLMPWSLEMKEMFPKNR